MTDEIRPPSRSPLSIDWVKTLSGALAAVSSAVLLSRLGAAGTIIGAALGSVVVTVASALYGQGLERSRARLVEAHSMASQRVGAAQAEVRRAHRQQARVGAADPAAQSDLRHAEEHLDDARHDLDRAAEQMPEQAATTLPATVPWRDRAAALPWRRVAVTAAVLFVGVVIAITAFELLAGRSVSTFTGGSDRSGGTSITRLGRTTGHSDTPAPAPSDAATPSVTPDGAASQAPSEVPAPTPSQDAPTVPTTPSPSDLASPSPVDPTAPVAPQSATP